MGDVKLNSSGGGSVTLTPPSTASNYTVTLPAATSTLIDTTSTQTLTNKTIASLVTTGTATFGGIVNTGSTGQVQFPATQNPSSDPNTLDDYEEGTWTPTLSALGGGAATTYDIRTGVYTKIGNLVWAYFYLNVAKGTLSGNLMVTGLPFTGIGTSGSVYPGAAFSYWSGLTNAKVYVGGYVTTGTASFELHSSGAATTSMGALAAADLGAGQNYFICQWCYAV